MSRGLSEILFNPYFCGLIIYEVVKAYEKEEGKGLPFSYVFFILPLILPTSVRKSMGTNKTLESWMNNNPRVSIQFPSLMESCIDLTKESLICLMTSGHISINDSKIMISSAISNEEIHHLCNDGDVVDCLDKAGKLASYLSKAGSAENLFQIMGVRP